MLSYEELKEKYGVLFDEELKIESTYKQIAADHLELVLNKYKAGGQASDTTIGRQLTSYRLDMLTEAYKEFVDKALAPKRGVKPTYVNTLVALDRTFEDRDSLCSMLAFAVLSSIINVMSDKGASIVVVSVAKGLAPIILAEFQYQEFLQYLTQEGMEKQKTIFLQGLTTRVSPHYRRHYMTISMEKDNYKPTHLPLEELMTLATQLLTVAEPVLEYYTIETGIKGMPQIIPTDKYIKGWKNNEQHLLDNCYRLCPTVIPPAEWTDYNHGGYYGDLAPKNKLLRLDGNKSNVFHKRYMKLLKQTDLSHVLKALNGVQNTPWVINRQVLAVVNDIIKLGGNRAGIPNIEEDAKPVVLPEEPTAEELAHYKAVMPGWYRNETRRKSIVLRALSHIKIANEFSKYEKIYFPCNLDFRGRLYPIPSFNFQGDDLNKSLILFADPPAFDSPEDDDWFYITGANIAGHDKISYADRIQWIEDNKQNIIMSAADPLCYRWWEEQDEPCQMLAFCFEFARLMEYKEAHDGSSIGFVTGLPSHQDGTCSGLQHFSAILRDTVGGTAVNLVPQDKPNDIYARVADVVNDMLQVDAVNGTPDEYDEDGKLHYGSKSMAQLWLSFGVNRKITKRETMTLAYGAKRYGYRDMLMDDIIEPAIIKQGDACVFNQYNKWRASAYMGDLIWDAVHKVVIKACEGMDWLQACSRVVTKGGRPVTWVTPLGLPIQQHYLDNAYKVIRMSVVGKRIRVYIPYETGAINKKKQGNGVAPNFIHSMDACHLQLAINYCLDAGIKHFSTIHDSYGCPMAQTKTMYKMVRQAFYDMYTKNDVLQNFKKDMSILTNSTIPEPPCKGDLDLSVVLDSKYVFC